MKGTILFYLVWLMAPMLSSGQNVISEKGKPIVIRGSFDGLKAGDSLRIRFTISKYEFDGTNVQRDTFVRGQEPFEIFVTKTDQPLYLGVSIDTIHSKGRRMVFLEGSLIEPGDTIILKRIGRKFSYSGSNSKFSYLSTLYQLRRKLYRQRGWDRVLYELKPTLEDYTSLDSITTIQLSYLDSIKQNLSIPVYVISKIDLLVENQTVKWIVEFGMANKQNYLRLPSPLTLADSNYPDFPTIERSLANYHDKIAEQLKTISMEYPEYLPFSSYSGNVMQNYVRDSCQRINRPYDFPQYYTYLKENYDGLLRERLVAQAVYTNLKKNIDKKYFVEDALNFIRNRDFRNFFESLRTGLNGDAAYKFKLPDMSGNIVRLDSLKSKVVLLDFWFTGCVPCLNLHANLEPVIDYFQNNPNVVIVSISIDEDKQNWLKSATNGEKGGHYTSIDKRNVINLYTDGQGKDHPLITYHRVKGYPTLILIDPDGNIAKTPTDPRSDKGKGMIEQIGGVLKKFSLPF